jgi:excisionase family DNA binding protein
VKTTDTTAKLTRATYTIAEAAELLGIGRNCAYESAKSGSLPVIRLGKRLLVPRAALDRLLAGEGPQTA